MACPGRSQVLRISLLITLLAMGAGGCAHEGASGGDAGLEPRTIRFDANDAGRAPRGFSVALTGGGPAPVWVVRSDAAAPGGPGVLVQESADETSYRFPLCVYDGVDARDVSAEVKWKAIAGKVDQAGGLVLRYRPENYYIARANALEDNIDVFKTVDGKRLKIMEVPVKVTGGAWHTLGFSAKGPHLAVTFDGRTVAEAEDRTFARPGKVGVWTKADSVSAFSELRIAPAR